MRRGKFLRDLEETVKINGDILQDYSQRIVILENPRPVIDPQGYVTQELRYVGNIYPPNFDICVNDQLTRQPRDNQVPRGASSGQLQVLTVEDIQVVAGKQQLQLRDRDRPVR